MLNNTFSVTRSSIRQVHAYNDGAPSTPLEEGQVRLRIQRFSLTSSNVTYAKLGEEHHYYAFFPAAEEGRGRIPAWGFAEVADSRAPGVDPGTRVFGFLPMSSHVVVTPVAVDPTGFSDGVAHRADRAPFYNRYTRCDADPAYSETREPYIALLRPQFSTAFLIESHLFTDVSNATECVILTSASSKTAYATAFQLSRRRGVLVLGLTSEGHRPFVEALGCYDDVITYESLDALPDRSALLGRSAALVDIAGNGSVRAAVRLAFGERLLSSLIVGTTHWDAPTDPRTEAGPASSVFSSSRVAFERIRQWGLEGLQRRLEEAWEAFMMSMDSHETPWLRVVENSGLDSVVHTYRSLLDGRVSPDEGHVFTI